MAEEKRRPGTGGQRPVGLRRAMSAIQRPSSGRPMSSARPRRPYSAYTKKGDEEESPKFEAPKSNREWWRAYLKVNSVCYLHLLLHSMLGDADTWVLQPERFPGRSSQRAQHVPI